VATAPEVTRRGAGAFTVSLYLREYILAECRVII